MRHSEETKPRWVIVDGVLRLVSEFADPKLGKRPQAFCPVCSTAAILKLGEQRVHHYAHKPDIICAATNPETALHLNVKYYLYEQLQRVNMILIEERCARGCGKVRETIWLKDWDTVNVEHNLGSIRPDVVLLKAGKPLGALEVLVSHRVSKEKASYLDQNNIPGLELLAGEEFYVGDDRWTPDRPLPFHRLFPSLPAWVCDECQENQRKRENQARLAEEQAIYKKNNHTQAIEARLVDFYFKTGKKYREVFYLSEMVVDGKRENVWVSNRKWKVIFRDEPASDSSLEKLHQAVENDLAEQAMNGTIVDIYTDWQPWIPGRKIAPQNFTQYPYRFQWDEDKEEWIKVIHQPRWEALPEIQQHPKLAPTYQTPSWHKAAVCEMCGELKLSDQYVIFNGATQTCICRDCLNKK